MALYYLLWNKQTNWYKIRSHLEAIAKHTPSIWAVLKETVRSWLLKWHSHTYHLHTCQLSRFSWESPSFLIKSPDLPVRAPNLPDKMHFWAFLCFSLKFSPFFHKIRTFLIHCTVSGTFLHMFSQWHRLVRHYNDESTFWSHVGHVRRHVMS